MIYATRVFSADTLITMDGGTDGRAPHGVTHIATLGEEIVAVGTRSEVEPWIGPHTDIVEWESATILPGLSDGHFHPISGALSTRGAVLLHARSLEEARRLVAEEAARAGEWVLGWGLPTEVFDGVVSGRLFDDVTAGKPMYLVMRDVHSAVVNSEALARAGVTGRELFADRSQIVVDAGGVPTGHVLEMQAKEIFERILPADPLSNQADKVYALLRAMAQSGLTSGQVMDHWYEPAAVLTHIERDRDLPIRLRISVMIQPGVTPSELERIARAHGSRGRRWSIEGVKFLLDGTVQGGTAWLEEPDTCGDGALSMWKDPKEYARTVRFFAEQGIPTATHAIGDRAVRHALDSLEAVPRSVRALAPHRVEHIESIPDHIVPRFAELDVIASMHVVHVTRFTAADGSDDWTKRLGPARAAHAIRSRDLVNSGATLVLGSDWPVTDYSPLRGIADAVLRRSSTGTAPSWQPEQALDLHTVLAAYTRDSAIARGHGASEGRIAPGFRADFTVLARDPFAVSPEALGEISVAATVVGGAIVTR